ncbi:uncharacterized protein LOC110978642 [Acanthaster planci]|uniref:Uncharacterized protein LOC110978642 n=1 Tax=Acanthaster planci TaxID=133434 RepID=A0A8B7YAA9_ACAPL|nr:uncharacterized protein LOC110978642 [Acanthaster planci]
MLKVAVCILVVTCSFESGFSQDPTDINHGCYFDHSQRALTDLITCDDARDSCHSSCGIEHSYCQSTGMTIDLCRSLCRIRNLRYYALEAGKQCFCGGALSNPFAYGRADGATTNCSHPCTGDVNKTCGGEFKMQVYEFRGPVDGADCFHPGFVENSYISDGVAITTGNRLNFICLPLHKITGEAQLLCQSNRTWVPAVLPSCSFTGVSEDTTTEVVKTTQILSTAQTTTASVPLTSITDFLPYIIGGSALLLFILVVCLVSIFVCKGRKRSGNSGQDIRLKPEASPVTFINTGFHNDENEEAKVEMPDILSEARNASSPSPSSFYHTQLSTFSEDPVYSNNDAVRANDTSPTTYANVNEGVPSTDSPPSPIYANFETVLPESNSGYTKRYSATTDRPNQKRGLSSDDPVAVHATGNRRAKKNATGTKDLVGWSRPSSLYQRTTLDDDDTESNEDNTTIQPHDLSAAIYAQIDKSRRSDSRETLNSEHSGNSFFADPAKSSATRL